MMPLPIDRLAMAGATADDLEGLRLLSEAEQASIAAKLECLAESGVSEFVERFRGMRASQAAALAEPEPPVEKPRRTSKPDRDES